MASPGFTASTSTSAAARISEFAATAVAAGGLGEFFGGTGDGVGPEKAPSVRRVPP
jgi:hypothetical protein